MWTAIWEATQKNKQCSMGRDGHTMLDIVGRILNVTSLPTTSYSSAYIMAQSIPMLDWYGRIAFDPRMIPNPSYFPFWSTMG